MTEFMVAFYKSLYKEYKKITGYMGAAVQVYPFPKQ